MMELSARNKLEGEILKIDKRGVISKVQIRVNAPFMITAVIAREAAEELELKEGNIVDAIIKATEVMLSK
ncbi:MAG: TOBE domain-containing protein [Candidatus Hodarchaeota archaeon]